MTASGPAGFPQLPPSGSPDLRKPAKQAPSYRPLVPPASGSLGNWKLEAGNWKLQIGNCKLESGIWKLETENWKLETGN